MSFKIEIDWFRHALSCRNVVPRDERRNHITDVKDPQITNRGVDQAEQTKMCLGASRLTYDLVCASVLTRAVETATVIWGDTYPIHVIPFVNEEVHWGRESEVPSLKVLHKNLETFKKKNKVKGRIDTSWVDPKSKAYKKMWKGSPWEDGSLTSKEPSASLFYAHVLPAIVKYLVRKHVLPPLSQSSSTFRIAIVSHGGFMGRNLQVTKLSRPLRSIISCGGKVKSMAQFVQNTSGWRETLKVDKKKGHQKLKRLSVKPYYLPNPRFGVYGLPLEKKSISNCPCSVQKAVFRK